MSAEHILDEFKRQTALYQTLRQHVEPLLAELLTAHSELVHSISSRFKTSESLRAKVIQPDKTYRELRDVTDLIGFRIVTYFEDSINQLAEIIEHAFTIDFRHSIDKRQPLDGATFGYRSLHYVVSLSPASGCPPELVGVPFEIQLRTILQHAWAEIEHDLGYKSKESIPQSVRRRFSRLAGLLEMADDEFVAIKQQLDQYQNALQAGLKQATVDTSLNRISLESFIDSPQVQRFDEAIARRLSLPLAASTFFPEYLCRMLEAVGLQSIKQVSERLLECEDELNSFVAPYFEFTERTWRFGVKNLDRYHRGYGLFFLGHWLAYKAGELDLSRLEAMTDFYEALDFPNNRTEARRVAQQFVEVMRAHAKTQAVK